MTTLTTRAVPTGRLRTLGLVTVVASLIGAACAVAIIAWPPQVSDDWYSYPFDATGYTVAQSFFGVHHLGMVAGLVGLARLARPRAARTTKAGLIIATLGWWRSLPASSLRSLRQQPVGAPAADAVNNSYSIPMMLIGLGLVLAGVGPARRPVLPGWGRWVTLALGAYVFVPMFPAVFGPMVLGRVAIGVWLLMFAALGVALMRADS